MRSSLAILFLALFLALPPGITPGETYAQSGLTKIAYWGEPSSIGPLDQFGPPDVNNSGSVAFKAQATPGADCALFVGDGVSPPVMKATDALSGTPTTPPGYGNITDLCSLLSRPPLITNGGPYAVFEGYVSAGRGIFVAPPSPGSAGRFVVATETVPAPVGGSFGPPELLDASEGPLALFSAPTPGGCAAEAMYIATGPSAFTLTVKAGGACPDPAPGGGTFTSLGTATMTATSTIAFEGTTSLGQTAIYSWKAGVVTLLVGPGSQWDLATEDVPPEMLQFTAVSEPRINNPEQVSFRGTLPLPYGDGYFLATGNPPVITKQVLEVDPSPLGGSLAPLASPGPHDLEDSATKALLTNSGGLEAVLQFDPLDVLAVEGETAPGTGGATYTGFGGGGVSEASFFSLAGTTAGGGCGAGFCPGIWRAVMCASLDGDGICDAWEVAAQDTNRDGDTDIDLTQAGDPGGAADPKKRDIYIEVDWMDCAVAGSNTSSCWAGHQHDPDDNAISDVVAAFANGANNNAAATEDPGGSQGSCTDGLDNAGDGQADAGIDLNGDLDYNDANEKAPDTDCTGVKMHVFQNEAIPHFPYLDWTWEDWQSGQNRSDSCRDGKDNSDLANDGVEDNDGDGVKDSDGDGVLEAGEDPDCEYVNGGSGFEDGNASCHDGIDNSDYANDGIANGNGDGQKDKGDGDGNVEQRGDGSWEDGDCEVIQDFDDTKALYFGTAADRAEADKDNISAKKSIYHYAIFAHLQRPGTTSSGRAEIMGNDFSVTLGGFTNTVGSRAEQAATFMHELGHNINLRHGGNENVNHKPNYLSIMNYSFQFAGSGWYVNSRPLDYSRWQLAALNEAGGLNEPKGIDNDWTPPGIGSWQTAFTTYFSADDKCLWKTSIPAAGDINWNNDSDSTDNNVSMGINGDKDTTPNSGQEENCQKAAYKSNLTSHNDWASIRLGFSAGGAWSDGAGLHYPYTRDEPETVGDADADGVNDLVDNCLDTPNAGQEDVVHPNGIGDACDNPDGDAWMDSVDGCPDTGTAWWTPSGDDDCDGYPSTVKVGMRGAESYMGTDSADNCPADTVKNNEDPDAWPMDNNDDRSANLADILAYIPIFGQNVPPGPPRFDINQDGKDNLSDILAFIPFFNMMCTP